MVVTTTYWSNRTATLHVGDAREVLATLPGRSVNCIVTSPPYWRKRDYGVPGQYGREPGPAPYVENLRSAFREARRVLADDGTCWLNLGDGYSVGGGAVTGIHAYLGASLAGHQAPGMRAKNLLGLPWRVAFALQEDGWIIRNAIVWHKPNAMPESVRDRLNCRHELIFLLVKQQSYWFDLDPIRIPHATSPTAGHPTARCRGGTTRPPGTPATGRHPGNRQQGNRPGGRRTTGNRPPKYATHQRGHGRTPLRQRALRPGAPQRP
jgi:DNA methylase